MKNFSLSIIFIFFIGFLYITVKAIEISNKTKISTSDGVYTSYTSNSKDIKQKAYELTKNCKTKLCKTQALLDFTSNIPYSTNLFQKNSPQTTIQQNFGDCDDKSNLLISMLHALNIEAYFVLVPKHIFVIVKLKDSRLAKKRGLWINKEKYYILESTAKNSKVAYPLRYRLNQIDAIVEPFQNKKIDIDKLGFRV